MRVPEPGKQQSWMADDIADLPTTVIAVTRQRPRVTSEPGPETLPQDIVSKGMAAHRQSPRATIIRIAVMLACASMGVLVGTAFPRSDSADPLQFPPEAESVEPAEGEEADTLLEQAGVALNKGRQYLQERNRSPENIFLAIRAAERASGLLDRVRTPTRLLPEAQALLEQARAALSQALGDSWGDYQFAIQRNARRDAMKALERILASVPDTGEKDHQEAAEKLRRLKAQSP